MRIHVGFSVNSIDWDIEGADFRLTGGDPEIEEWVYGYNPRVVKVGNKFRLEMKDNPAKFDAQKYTDR